MKTQAINPTENKIFVSKQTRLVLTLVGVMVAVVGSFTLLNENHTIGGFAISNQVSEIKILPTITSPKLSTISALTAVWPF